MRERRVRLLLLLAAIAVAALGAWRWPQLLPADLPALSPEPPGGDCARDPAGLPPPVAPDGRPANYLHTCGNRIYDSAGRQVKIAGLNWSGMETRDAAPGGLNGRNWQEILDHVAALGYNTIRVPFSNEAVDPDTRIVNVDFVANPDLEGLTGLEMLDRLVAGAGERGLKVILDRHRPTPDTFTDLWYTAQVPEERWLADWRLLAARYRGDDTVIGADLSNEPRGRATWGSGDPKTDWRLAAERAGNAVLEENPHLLVFVEGIESYEGENYWWGGNLQGVRNAPVRLSVPNRLVYSPHDYGPAISEQGWFWDARYPANLPAVWDRHWGYIHAEGIAPVVVGEFGGHSVGDDRDGQWQRSLIAYLEARDIGALVWSLNPGWDTGGILREDWRTVEGAKHEAYRQLLSAPIAQVGQGGSDGSPTANESLRLLYRQEPATGGEIAFAFRVLNQTKGELDPSRVELRYWLTGDGPAPAEAEDAALSAETSGADVVAAVAAAPGGRQYLSLRFKPGAQPVPRYRATAEVRTRLRGLLAAPDRAADYSYAGPSQATRRFVAWNRVTLYLDGALVWGREP